MCLHTMHDMYKLLWGPVRKLLHAWPINSAQVWLAASFSSERVKKRQKAGKTGHYFKVICFFVLNLSQAASLALYSPLHLYGACMAWIFLVEVEAVEGSHQGANYSLRGCLVSSIFYWRYGEQGARLPIPYHQCSAPTVPPFIRQVSQGSSSPKSRSWSGPELPASRELAHTFLLGMQWCGARGECVLHTKQFVRIFLPSHHWLLSTFFTLNCLFELLV